MKFVVRKKRAQETHADFYAYPEYPQVKNQGARLRRYSQCSFQRFLLSPIRQRANRVETPFIRSAENLVIENTAGRDMTA